MDFLTPMAGDIAQLLRKVKSTINGNLIARVTHNDYLMSKLGQLMNQFDSYKSQ